MMRIVKKANRKLAGVMGAVLALSAPLLSMAAESKSHESTRSSLSDWASGGGFVPSERQNPWFLQNLSRVEYCVETNENDFGASLEMGRRAVKQALSYWQRQLDFHNKRENPDPNSSTNPQAVLSFKNLVETDCSATTDLRFQLGVLHDDQKQYISNPSMIIGQTVMTAYNRRQLQGRGFIYIAPESGDLAPKGSKGGQWTIDEGKLLTIMIAHELGHVLGIQHNYHNSTRMLMDAKLPWYLIQAFDVSPEVRKVLIESALPDFFFGNPVTYFEARSCLNEQAYVQALERVLGVNERNGCLRLIVHELRIQILYSKNEDAAERVIYDENCSGLGSRGGSVSELFLSEGQEVFGQAKDVYSPFIESLEFRDITRSCERLDLTIRSSDGELSLSGVDQSTGKYSLDFWDFHKPVTRI